MTEEERRELDSLAASLGNASRLQRLVLYICEKYFQGEADKLHEYEIATDLFGRSRDTFDPAEDAVVRVEAHRLRKRLKEYYEGPGKDHPIQISVPAGSYVPVFLHQDPAPEAEAEKIELPASPPRRAPWRLLLAASAALILILTVLILAVLRHHGADGQAAEGLTPTPSSVPALPGQSGANLPLRILAGYSGRPQVDSAGAVWLPDRYFHYGGNWEHPEAFVLRTGDPMLYQHWRDGFFSYDIPLPPGNYELHLYFNHTAKNPNLETLSTFSVVANSQPLLTGFDIATDAMGVNTADERVFRDISPGRDGILHLYFTSERAPAELNALEVLPGLPHSLLPIRIVTQPVSFTDHLGQFWHPDNYFLGGYTAQGQEVMTGIPDPGLYSGERYGNFSYSIPVDPRDQYTLILHFAEFYFGPNASGIGGAGSRVFRILCNGNILLDNFDIYKEAGSLHPLVKSFYHLKPTSQGKLNLSFEPIANNATVSAIEVIDESK